MRRSLWILFSLQGLVAILVVGFVAWGETPAQPMPEALTALGSDSQVTVQSGKWLTFLPEGSQPSTGFIIYPGGRVDDRAYAPRPMPSRPRVSWS